MGDDRPIILTAMPAGSAQAWFDELRRRRFPPERNHLDAHLTLFHHLPGEQETAIADEVSRAADRPPPTARVTGPRACSDAASRSGSTVPSSRCCGPSWRARGRRG